MGKCSFIGFQALLIGCRSYPSTALNIEGVQGLTRVHLSSVLRRNLVCFLLSRPQHFYLTLPCTMIIEWNGMCELRERKITSVSD